MDRNYFKLNRIPFAVKLYVGFALFVFLLMGLIQLHSYINRPEQMQSLQLYEQKLETISSKKINEKYYASGRASQNNNLEITYDSVTIDDVKEILSKQNIGWNEISKNRIVGHDYDTNVYIELFKERGSNKVVLILQKRN
ncbi:MAG: hypothetical protein E7E42_02560 [Veillonella sp.]|uniref:hypothetical protein n=1 Tax=Veillonella sp. TaxID=1926307 RepID=UPI0025E49745|nr:hypothetical protein [Veillonella sp.]MDU2208539.1 hypothetical protein [Veillonella sp.]